jgi:hypothetical protein
MKQSRLMSLVEAVANVFIGYGVAVITQILIFPVFGLHTTLAQNLKMGAVFTAVSIARSFALRRVFEAFRVRSAKRETAAPMGRRSSVCWPVSVRRREVCTRGPDPRPSPRSLRARAFS